MYTKLIAFSPTSSKTFPYSPNQNEYSPPYQAYIEQSFIEIFNN